MGQVSSRFPYSVMVDDMKGIRSVVDYLYEKGSRGICSISMTRRRRAAGRNVRGFLEAMKLHDIAGAEKNVVHCRHGLEG